MKLKSTAFEHNGVIPESYTQDGDNVSPALSWFDVPKEAVELALLVEDPDAPEPAPFVHWVAYGIDPARDGLAEDSAGGALEGLTTNGKIGYDGPAPPADGGPHRYRFRLYALSKPSGLEPGGTGDELLAKIKGHILARAELVGTYEREMGETEE
jgi:Raf kinase inhibitor-like YbhB/YbcL family protein